MKVGNNFLTGYYICRNFLIGDQTLPRKNSRPKREYSQKKPGKGTPPLNGRVPAKSMRTARNVLPGGGESPGAVTFASLLRPLVAEPSRPLSQVTLQSSPLAHLDYPAELKIKEQGPGSFLGATPLAGETRTNHWFP